MGPGQEQCLPGGLVRLATQGRAPGFSWQPLWPPLPGSVPPGQWEHRAFLLCEEEAAHWPCSSPGDSYPPVQAQSLPPRLLQMVFSQEKSLTELLPSPGVSQDPLGRSPGLRANAWPPPVQAGGLIFRAALRSLPRLHHLLRLLILMCSRPGAGGALRGTGGQGQPPRPHLPSSVFSHMTISLSFKSHTTQFCYFCYIHRTLQPSQYRIPEHFLTQRETHPSSRHATSLHPQPLGTASLSLSADLSVPGSAGHSSHTVHTAAPSSNCGSCRRHSVGLLSAGLGFLIFFLLSAALGLQGCLH